MSKGLNCGAKRYSTDRCKPIILGHVPVLGPHPMAKRTEIADISTNGLRSS
jgi:hypothetical protein